MPTNCTVALLLTLWIEQMTNKADKFIQLSKQSEAAADHGIDDLFEVGVIVEPTAFVVMSLQKICLMCRVACDI